MAAPPSWMRHRLGAYVPNEHAPPVNRGVPSWGGINMYTQWNKEEIESLFQNTCPSYS
jgi:hypothetical protein